MAVLASWQRRLRNLDDFREVLARFPVVIALLLAMTLTANLLIQDVGSAERVWQVLLGLGCAAAAALSVTIGLEAWQQRNDRAGQGLRQLIAATLGAAVFLAVWFAPAWQTSAWLLAFGLVTLVPLAPYLSGGSGDDFRGFLGRLTFTFLLAAIGWNLLGGGLSLVFVSVNVLFGLDVPFALYLHTAVMTGLLFAPLLWLALIPREFSLEADCRLDTQSAKAIGVLGDFIATPLLLIYALILHLYVLRCLIVGELPSGQSGWLVSGFGICLLLALVICRPFMQPERALVRLFLGWWPWLLPVPLVLLSVAIGMRVSAFGFTVQRYLLVTLLLVLVLAALAQCCQRWRGDVRLLAAIPVIVMLLASVGPWGAEGVSIRSQSERFLALAERAEMDADAAREAVAALRYLDHADALARVLPAGESSEPPNPDGGRLTTEELARQWRIDPASVAEDASFVRVFSRADSVAVAGFDTLVNAVAVDAESETEVALPSGVVLRLQLEGQSLRVSSATLMRHFEIPADLIGNGSQDESPSRPIRLHRDGIEVVLLPEVLSGETTPSVRLEGLTGSLLLHADDWR